MDHNIPGKRWFRFLTPSRCPREPRRIRLHLEELEPRLALSTTPMPPTVFQAAQTLFFDGANLVVNNVTFQPNNAVLASIAANSPTVGPLAPLVVLAGELAEWNYLQAAVPLAHALAEFPGSPGAA
jgi:hypothetical protein